MPSHPERGGGGTDRGDESNTFSIPISFCRSQSKFVPNDLHINAGLTGVFTRHSFILCIKVVAHFETMCAFSECHSHSCLAAGLCFELPPTHINISTLRSAHPQASFFRKSYRIASSFNKTFVHIPKMSSSSLHNAWHVIWQVMSCVNYIPNSRQQCDKATFNTNTATRKNDPQNRDTHKILA